MFYFSDDNYLPLGKGNMSSSLSEFKPKLLPFRKGYLKKDTEGLLMAAQVQALWQVDNVSDSELCIMCDERNETVSHNASEGIWIS